MTSLIGVSTDHGQTVTFETDGTLYGIPVMDDNAHQGESFTIAGSTSTIVSVGGTQQYGSSRYSQIDDINVDAITGSTSFNWAFARGVGFTSITQSGRSVTLATFSIDVATSQSTVRARTQGIARAVSSESDAKAVRAVMERFFDE